MTETITLTAGMFADSALKASAVQGVTGLQTPCIDLPDGSTSLILVNTPVPTNWNGAPITLQMIYESDIMNGQFNIATTKDGKITDSFVNLPQELITSSLASPIGVNIPSSHSVLLNFNAQLSPDTLDLSIRRSGAQDTASGVMQVIAVRLVFPVS